MRPPRPWPSWRRAMSPSIDDGSSSRPAGSPSTIVVRPGPCDSPAVTTFKGTGRDLNERRRARRPAALHRLPPQGLERRATRGQRQALDLAQRAGLAVEGVPGLAVQLAQQLATRGRRLAQLGLLRRLGRVDLHELQLVLGVGLGAGVVDRDELGLAGAQPQDLAV